MSAYALFEPLLGKVWLGVCFCPSGQMHIASSYQTAGSECQMLLYSKSQLLVKDGLRSLSKLTGVLSCHRWLVVVIRGSVFGTVFDACLQVDTAPTS